MNQRPDDTTVLERGSGGRETKPLVSEKRWLLRAGGVEGSPVETSIELPRNAALTVGRHPRDDGLVVADMKMSRAHFQIGWDPACETYRITDLESRNHTYLNGRPVHSATLRADDVIRAGDSLFICHASDETSGDKHAHIAQSDIPVLLIGETGTGKDCLARRLHELSGRNSFVALNCGALPRELVTSELFGYARGAFSGASSARAGLFQAAHGGTLFLDEVSELPIDLQPSLLRALESGRVRAVGTDHEVSVDARIIAATNSDPKGLIESGRFRADLYARLAGLVCHLQPLRRRRHHILELAASLAQEAGLSARFTPDARETLLLWEFPYNVRELKSLIRALSVLVGHSPQITLEHLHGAQPEMVTRLEARRAEPVPTATPTTNVVLASKLAATLRPRGGDRRINADLERLEAALREHDGHLGRAAQDAQISRQRAQRLLQQFPDRDPRRWR